MNNLRYRYFDFRSIIKGLFYFILMLVVIYILALFISNGGIIATGALVGFPIVSLVILMVFLRPSFGMMLAMILALTVIGLTRYIDAPLGLSMDGIFALTLVSSFFNVPKEDRKRLKNSYILTLSIWLLFVFLQLFNPEAVSSAAWFYASRQIGLYWIFIAILTFLVFNSKKNFEAFLFIFLIGGIVSGLYGAKQLHIGLNAAENAWLAAGAADEHLLFGKLRVFSFFSDAGQFGAFQAYCLVIAIILSLHTESFRKRIFYISAAVVCLYGMLISGTRGAFFVPMTGLIFYLILTKKVRIVLIGLVFLSGVFCFLKFTYIGQGNYNIQRMRSAVNPSNDASFQVRLENQQKMKEYLRTRPFGGGIGTAGYWGQRFSPNTFLARTPTDSYYVRIWCETGIVGLYLHLFILIFLFVVTFYKTWRIRDSLIKQKMMAIYAGALGIAVASYGNQVISQMPTTVFFIMSLAYLYIGPEWDKKSQEKIASPKP